MSLVYQNQGRKHMENKFLYHNRYQMTTKSRKSMESGDRNNCGAKSKTPSSFQGMKYSSEVVTHNNR